MSGAMLAVALLCACSAAPAARALQVPRCCRAGQRLDLDRLLPAAGGGAELSAEQAAALCAPAEPGSAWAPRVFAPARGVFLPAGRLPAHWRAAERALPACARLRALPDHAAVYALLANNASLHERGAAGAAATVPPERYCAEVGAALVCADGAALAAAAAPSKCCGGGGRAWDGARCVDGAAAAAAAAESTAQLARLAGAPPAGGWPACAGSRYAVAGLLAGAALAKNGSLRLAGGAALPAGAWCAEAVLGAGGGGGARVLACEAAAGAGAGAGAGARHAVYGAALAVGALFLAATLAASLMLPAAHHALHWRCQTHYVAALMLGDALLAATQLAGAAVPPALCRALAVLMHFLFLSAFFWLNTMCFNIWWTFRDFRPTSLERGQEAWRLRVYSLYAWGAPLLLAGAGALLDAWPGAGGAGGGGLLRPRFGEQRCWFYGDTEILVYFFGPVGVLLLVNLALFASTTRQLTCGLWRRDEVKSTAERAALGRVCAKLVVVMGVTWGLDVASWALGGPEYVWYATDLLNALQGVLIFLVVGCQRHSLAGAAACWRRVRGGGGAGGGAGSGGGARHTHSSTQLPSCGESLTHTTHAAPAAAPAAAAPAPGKLPMETVC